MFWTGVALLWNGCFARFKAHSRNIPKDVSGTLSSPFWFHKSSIRAFITLPEKHTEFITCLLFQRGLQLDRGVDLTGKFLRSDCHRDTALFLNRIVLRSRNSNFDILQINLLRRVHRFFDLGGTDV